MQVSCVIPTRDRRDMVQAAVASVLAQEGTVPEVVVVDDGSRDGTREALLARFPRVRQVSSPGLGPGPARNLGVEAATGGVLMFLDSDDRWRPHHVRALLDVLDRGLEVAYGATRNWDAFNRQAFMIPEKGEEGVGNCFHQMVRWCFLVPSSAAVTRKAFEAVGGYGPERLGEDWLFFLKLAARFPFGYAPQTITDRLLHPGSLCCLEDNRTAIVETLDRVLAFLRQSEAAEAEDLERIVRMRSLATGEGEKCRTIQEWYLCLKRHGLA